MSLYYLVNLEMLTAHVL